jgi:transcriptional regulator with XRE-family HTH domain
MDGATQPRAELNQAHLDDLVELLLDGHEFDKPIVVFYDGTNHWLADGFHRVNATKLAGLDTVETDVRPGTLDEAIAYSCGANATHGLRRTKGDIKRSVSRLVQLPGWKGRTQAEIAEQCKASQSFVSKILKELNYDCHKNTTNQPVEPVEEVEQCVTLRTPREVVAQWFADNPELEHLSNREIARRCGVTEGTVRNYRKELQDEREKAAQENAEVEPLKEPEAVAEPEPVVEATPEPEPEPAVEPEPETIEEVIETPEPEPATSENAEVEDAACEDEDEDVSDPEPTETVADSAIEIDEDEEDYDEDECEDVSTPEPVSEPEQPIEEQTIVTAEPEPESEPVEDTAKNETDPATGEQEASAPAVVRTDDVEEEEEEKHVQSQGLPPALTSSESNEWYTPAQYVYAARELMRGIDVDPASNATANQIIKALTYYDIESNGLDKPWYGRVWLNPPYGRDNDGGSNQAIWSHRLLEQYRAGITKEAVLLVNANTGTKWFQPFYDYLICFTNHRIKFYTSDGTPNQPTQDNALIYLGPQQDRFIEIFEQFGVVLKRARRKIA